MLTFWEKTTQHSPLTMHEKNIVMSLFCKKILHIEYHNELLGPSMAFEVQKYIQTYPPINQFLINQFNLLEFDLINNLI